MKNFDDWNEIQKKIDQNIKTLYLYKNTEKNIGEWSIYPLDLKIKVNEHVEFVGVVQYGENTDLKNRSEAVKKAEAMFKEMGYEKSEGVFDAVL